MSEGTFLQIGSSISIEDNDLISSVSDNLSHELIRVTKDKLELCLRDHCDIIEKRNSWTTPLAIIITVIVTLCSSDFNNNFIFDSSVWYALFIIGGIVATIWFIYAFKYFFKSSSIDDIIECVRHRE